MLVGCLRGGLMVLPTEEAAFHDEKRFLYSYKRGVIHHIIYVCIDRHGTNTTSNTQRHSHGLAKAKKAFLAGNHCFLRWKGEESALFISGCWEKRVDEPPEALRGSR